MNVPLSKVDSKPLLSVVEGLLFVVTTCLLVTWRHIGIRGILSHRTILSRSSSSFAVSCALRRSYVEAQYHCSNRPKNTHFKISHVRFPRISFRLLTGCTIRQNTEPWQRTPSHRPVLNRFRPPKAPPLSPQPASSTALIA
ncbi:hypothetical protein BDR07DRAFT_523917 [Suillus spraguei]|nr:hypothetical protein BDR07DRAFT_523917 [Suillus spraguei]